MITLATIGYLFLLSVTIYFTAAITVSMLTHATFGNKVTIELYIGITILIALWYATITLVPFTISIT